MAVIICPMTINGVEVTKKLVTSATANVASFVTRFPGVGKPFYVFATDPLPGVSNIAADYEGAPIVSAVVADNQTAIDAMLANPPLDKVFPA